MPTLEQLQAAEAAQSSVQLRTLALEFADTLNRLPRLRQEIEGWLSQPAEGVDYTALASRVEPQLVAAADWLLDYDMLPAAVRDSSEMQAFMDTVETTVTSRTVAGMVQKFAAVKDAAAQASGPNAVLAKLGYVDNGNGTITDKKTGLMWKRTWEEKCTWTTAVERYQPGEHRFAGFNDWRLPTIGELRSLFIEGQTYPAYCREAFPSSDEWFWSSSESGDDYAWYVSFSAGSVENSNRRNGYAVRLVRSSQ